MARPGVHKKPYLVLNHCGNSLYRLGNISENKLMLYKKQTPIFLERKKKEEEKKDVF